MGDFGSDYMYRALALAERGRGATRPNPPVGAVIVRNGKIVGEGWHKKAGGDHAEVAAIKKAGEKARGATLYVTLEPCSKQGRVGACTQAIIDAKIAKVYFLETDPNPKNKGGARRALKKANILCEKFKADKELKAAARRLLAPFAKHVTTMIPFVTVKLAMSLDGKICDYKGDAKWVSSAKARAITGALREKVDVIMVGGETLRKDNPSLLSHSKPNKNLVRAIVSRSGNLPKEAQVFTDGKNKTLVFNDAKSAVIELGKMGYMHILCEGGLNLAANLAKEGLVDEWICVLAPKVIADLPISKAIKVEKIECLPDSFNE
ncbi:MAG: bifunctional diaminohydroxyphosphoribosylaminopyrimidine deaminase/5-amino-6-(5-phosphoribosylamino)uracil reductase RibD [Kiritimatiellae bacterium]|nr:bifunctional diaminohydroxyphosphoribosylaminopyrimidine deaminase/5-amino-6-(5-phosphoribosylamino)uracil reductase RibD [Kiritimatiellia bacterium]